MATKDYGWVLQLKKNSSVYIGTGIMAKVGTYLYYKGPFVGGSYGVPLAKAHAYDTREEARDLKDHDEVVRKVLLDKDGKPMQIIAGR
jgi:hypothetical protein